MSIARRIDTLERKAGIRNQGPPTKEEYWSALRRVQARYLLEWLPFYEEWGITSWMLQGRRVDYEASLLAGDSQAQREADERIIEVGQPFYKPSNPYLDAHIAEQRAYQDALEEDLTERLQTGDQAGRYSLHGDDPHFVALWFAFLLEHGHRSGFVRWAGEYDMPEEMLSDILLSFDVITYEQKGQRACFVGLVGDVNMRDDMHVPFVQAAHQSMKAVEEEIERRGNVPLPVPATVGSGSGSQPDPFPPQWETRP